MEWLTQRVPMARPRLDWRWLAVLGWLVVALLALGSDLWPWVGANLGLFAQIGFGVGATLIVPGLALVRWFWVGGALDWGEELALALGGGVAVFPLFLQACSLIGLPWNRWTVGLYALAMLVALLWPRGRRLERTGIAGGWGWALAVLIGLVALARLVAVRGMPAGQWGDSLHHTMIAQLLVDNQGLFKSWEPYAPFTTFTYHVGFHTASAGLHMMSGISVPQSVIQIGQVMNLGAALGAYGLTTRLSGRPLAGIWALLLTGLVNVLPAFYMNWGRYTQLTGQVILPALLIVWLVLLERERWSWRGVVLPALLTGGLCMTHYVVTIWAAVFVVIMGLVLIARRPQQAWLIARLGIVAALIGLVLALPWLLNVREGRLTNIPANAIAGTAQHMKNVGSINQPLTPTYLQLPALLAALAGVWVALMRRSWRMGLCAAWWLALFIMIVPFVINVPLTGLITNFAAYIGMYIVAMPLAGYALSEIDVVGSWLSGKARGAEPEPSSEAERPLARRVLGAWVARFSLGLTIVALIGVSMWGVHWQARVFDPGFQIFTPADEAAMEWIRSETAPDARFYVASFAGYAQGKVYVGDDGGWWISYFTGREVTMPPLVYTSEIGPYPEYVDDVINFHRSMLETPPPSPEGLALAEAEGIDYIYVGARQSTYTVKYRDMVQALRYEPERFPIVYERDGVVIFALRTP